MVNLKNHLAAEACPPMPGEGARPKFAAVLMHNDLATGKSTEVFGIPFLQICGNYPACKKRESKTGEFQRCKRCQIHFCSRECQRAEHKRVGTAICRETGKKIDATQEFYNKCKFGCGERFKKHRDDGHFYEEFQTDCGNCAVRRMFGGDESA